MEEQIPVFESQRISSLAPILEARMITDSQPLSEFIIQRRMPFSFLIPFRWDAVLIQVENGYPHLSHCEFGLTKRSALRMLRRRMRERP
jgi:hypothetical protein